MRLRLELRSHGGNAAGFVIPDAVVDELGGGRRPKVAVTVNGHTFRTSIARMGDVYMLGLSQERRAEAGVAAGEVLDLEVELDEAPREVEVPPDLADLLDADPGAAAAWARASYSRRKEWARSIEGAKRPETRTARLERTMTALRSA
jgi:antitoxin component of MazEF toxin-antitoxin module